MTKPELPPVPDVVPFEDEPAKETLRNWAETYACQYAAWHCGEEARKRRAAEAWASRLQYPDTTGQ